jgi:uncharacterized protein CbrC (UPF0167 family)
VILPAFRYHPDPLASGSVVASDTRCRRCGESRGYIYTGPVYAEAVFEDALCPWCIADGSAHRDLGATFVDREAFPPDVPAPVAVEISERTPGYHAWQSEEWPACCNDATAFLAPAGITELRTRYRELEAGVLSHIIYNMQISGWAATRLLESLDRDAGPTVYLFRCLRCGEYQFHVDSP